jgi:prophage regulatory protein
MTNGTDALIDVKEASRIAGISRTEVWRQVKAGTFPKPARLGSRCTRYSLSEVSEWVRQSVGREGSFGKSIGRK